MKPWRLFLLPFFVALGLGTIPMLISSSELQAGAYCDGIPLCKDIDWLCVFPIGEWCCFEAWECDPYPLMRKYVHGEEGSDCTRICYSGFACVYICNPD